MLSDKKQPDQNTIDLQTKREQREAKRAQERAKNQHADLRAKERESKTSYGYALFNNYAELLSHGVNLFLARKLHDPSSAGRHHSCWEFLLHFCNGGPRSIAVVALTPIIDRISVVQEKKKLGSIIGRAFQDELNGTVVHEAKGATLLALVKKKYGRKTVSAEVMRKLKANPVSWTTEEKRELGCLMIDIIISSTHLIEEKQQGTKLLIHPTECVKELIRNEPPRAMSIRRLPSLVPLEPWTDVVRNGKPLVSSRRPMDLSHIHGGSVATQIGLVNCLEDQEMVIDQWIIGVQRAAWDAGLPVFPVSREPDPRQVRSPEDDRRRARIEESIRQGEEVAGRPIWLEHDLDWRGRIYVSSRIAGHQGPDHQKAMVNFGRGEVMDEAAFEHLLQAAAGHFGLSKSSWAERLAWGQANTWRMTAIATDPLDRIDLWKEAADPWQFLQLAKAVHQWLMDPSKKVHVPVRFDQTCSGMGIIGALTRDEELCRLTNGIGDSRQDLYRAVAEDLQWLLTNDLQGFDFASQRMAEMWLGLGITREVCKGPTMTTIYGARHFGIVEQLTAWLMKEKGIVPLDQWEREFTWPAQYLARKLNIVIANRLKSCVALDAWLRGVSKACMKRQQRIKFYMPMGFPLALGSELEAKQKIATVINGTRRWKTTEHITIPGELSARATNRGITANVIHGFDASFCHAVVERMAGRQLHVITNHDCFATLPSRAGRLHEQLLEEMNRHYSLDWLTEMRSEIGANAGIDIPEPPIVGTLAVHDLGQNPYCFS